MYSSQMTKVLEFGIVKKVVSNTCTVEFKDFFFSFLNL